MRLVMSIDVRSCEVLPLKFFKIISGLGGHEDDFSGLGGAGVPVRLAFYRDHSSGSGGWKLRGQLESC